ncbi:MAG: hypothetical protein EOO29_57805 [Comamonadaceae bacterium]|nr:MAG: hypothetical protein EOO29_57805 [Comamonadaceae bacterium]
MNTTMHVARFTAAYWCVLIAALLPVVCAVLAKRGSFRLSDNGDPRSWLARQTGWRGRANAAQANSFEALPFFIGAVVIAHQLGAPQTPTSAFCSSATAEAGRRRRPNAFGTQPPE